MIKAIIFDFDGVLVESVDIKTKTLAKLFEKERADAVKKIIEYHVVNAGISRFEKFKHIYKDILNRQLTEIDFKHLCVKFSKLVKDAVIEAPYVDGAMVFLNKYHNKYKCFIASATPQDEIESILKERKMTRFFAAVYGAPNQKKDIVKIIIDVLKLTPGEVVYIGDALSDYEAAKENGTIFIARVTGSDSVLHAIDSPKVDDLRELETMLNRIAISEGK